ASISTLVSVALFMGTIRPCWEPYWFSTSYSVIAPLYFLGSCLPLCREGVTSSLILGSVGEQKGSGGKIMKHFTTENWIDFVNQAVDVSERKLMEQHLKQGCQRWTKTVALWKGVR